MRTQYIVGRLISGEMVMGELREATVDSYIIRNPLQIKTYPNSVQPGKIEETIAAAPLCSFTAADLYKIAKTNFIYAAELHDMYIPLYNRIVDEYFTEVEVEDPREEEGEELTVDNLEKILSTLQEKMHRLTGSVEPTEEEGSKLVFLRGNNTKH